MHIEQTRCQVGSPGINAPRSFLDRLPRRRNRDDQAVPDMHLLILDDPSRAHIHEVDFVNDQ